MALRVNPQTGKRERQQPDGSWAEADSPQDAAAARVAQAAQSLGQGAGTLDAALGGLDLSGEPSAGEVVSDADIVASLKVAPESPPPAVAAQVVEATPSPEPEGEPSLAQDDDGMVLDIPGLVSDDGGRGSSGSRKIRDRLRSKGRSAGSPTAAGAKGRIARKQTSHVRVPKNAATVFGPAVDDTTQNRQNRGGGRLRKRLNGVAAQNGKGARYVISAPPALLKDRPKWVQELFEAHFRADSTLQMRRQITGYTSDGKPKNRMKLSREDFAIGWLTAFDKFREDSRLLRSQVVGAA